MRSKAFRHGWVCSTGVLSSISHARALTPPYSSGAGALPTLRVYPGTNNQSQNLLPHCRRQCCQRVFIRVAATTIRSGELAPGWQKRSTCRSHV